MTQSRVTAPAEMSSISACSIRVRGVVQGVGFRPFVYRLASANALAGWVLNGDQGVEIHLEGSQQSLRDFINDLKAARRKPRRSLRLRL